MFLNKHLNYINIKFSLQRPCLLQRLIRQYSHLVPTLDTVLYFWAVQQFAPSLSLISFMRDQFEMPRTGKDSKETVSFPNLVLIIDERWRELFPALQVHRCVSNLRNTMVSPRNSAQPFRPSLESESLLTRYFPKNDSSAAGVR